MSSLCFAFVGQYIQNCICVCVCASYCTFLMSSSVWISGESPPCTHRNCWFIRAARGRQSNASMQESYTCSEYLILPGGGWRGGEIFQDLRQRSAWVCFDMLWTASIPANVQSVPVTWSVTVTYRTETRCNKEFREQTNMELFTWTDLKDSVI